jgi:hypothetical protein
MRSRRWGTPRSTRRHCPSRSTRYAEKAHGMPFAWSGSAEGTVALAAPASERRD